MRAPAASAAVAAWLVGASAVLAQPATDYDDRIIDACLSEHWGGLNARESCIGIAARACMPVGEGDAAVAVACFDAERAQWDARMTDSLDALRDRLAEQGGAGGAGSSAAGEAAESGGTDSAAAESAASETPAADAAEESTSDAAEAAAPAPTTADNTANADAPATNPADTGTTENPALTALNTMQSAWETWRDAACAYDAALYPGSPVADTVRADCLMRLTARQAFHLTARLERGD